jgi:hypothetical protein
MAFPSLKTTAPAVDASTAPALCARSRTASTRGTTAAQLRAPLVRYPRRWFEGFGIPERSLDLLDRVGLPEPHSIVNMRFDPPDLTEDGVLPTPGDVFKHDDAEPADDDDSEWEIGPVIGGDGGGDLLVIAAESGEVCLFDDESAEASVVAPSVEALVTGLVLLERAVVVCKPMRSREDDFPEVLVDRYVAAIGALGLWPRFDVLPSKTHAARADWEDEWPRAEHAGRGRGNRRHASWRGAWHPCARRRGQPCARAS